MRILVTCPPMLGMIESFSSTFKKYDVENLTEADITKIIEDKKKYEASKKKK